MKKAVLFFVLALTPPGPKWRKISDPVPREEAAIVVAGEWKQGHLARAVPEKKQAAA